MIYLRNTRALQDLKTIVVFFSILFLSTKAGAQSKEYLDSLSQAIIQMDQIPDSVMTTYLSNFSSNTDSALVEEILLKLNHQEEKISASSVINLAKKEMALFPKRQKVSIWNKAIKVLQERKDRDTVNLAFAINSLGEYLNQSGKADEAIDHFIQAISLFPENSLEQEIGYSFNNLGVLMGRKGDEGSALPYKKRALEIFSHHLGKDHPYMGTLQNNVGMSYYYLGDNKAALPFLLEALESNRKHYDQCSDQMYTINNNLGLAYRNLLDFQKAEDYIQSALDCIGEENIKSDPRYIKLLTVLASVKQSNKENYSRDDIVKTYESYINTAEKHLGKNHLASADLYNNFGVYLHGSDRAQDCIGLYKAHIFARYTGANQENYLEILRSIRKQDKPGAMKVLTNLGSALLNEYRHSQDTLLLDESRRVFQTFDLISGSLRPDIINVNSRITLKAESKRGYVFFNRTLLEAYKIKPAREILDLIFMNTEKIKNWELLENYSFSKRSNEIAASSVAREIDSLKNAMGLSATSKVSETSDLRLTLLLDKLKNQSPEYYQRLYGDQVSNLDALQRQCSALGEDWIIYFFKSDGEFASMLVNSDTIILDDSGRLNKTLDTEKTQLLTSLQLKNYDFVAHSQSLYDLLLRNFEPHFVSEHLKISPHSSLINLPFSILINSAKESKAEKYQFAYLFKEYRISYAYSASLNIETRKQSRLFKSSLFVAPSYKNLALKFNSEEVKNGIKHIGGKLLEGQNANKEVFKSAYRAADHMHFAGHITASERIDSTFLLMNNDLDSLFLSEIAEEKTATALVVLSGCESALGEASAEALISPAYGFTFAGSPNVVASLWKSNDESSAILFDKYYQYLRDGNGSIRSLQLAKLDYLQNAVKPERHPIYWAPFIYYGNEVHWEEKVAIWKFLIPVLVFFLIFGFWKLRASRDAS